MKTNLTTQAARGCYQVSELSAPNTDNAWVVNFNDGSVNNDDKTNDNNNRAWCVRGGVYTQ